MLTVIPAGLDRISLHATTSTLMAGQPGSYAVEGFDRFDNTLGDKTSAATLAISGAGSSCAAGSCWATRAGEHTVTATLDGLTDTKSPTVTPAGLDRITLSPGARTVTAGEDQGYAVNGFDRYDNALGDRTSATTLTISGAGASCTAGSCTATTAGQHIVTATVGALTDTANLTVVPAALHRISLAPATATVVAGAPGTYAVAGFDRFGNSLGDRTSAATLTISGAGSSCAGSTCTSTKAGEHTVTATIGRPPTTRSSPSVPQPSSPITLSPRQSQRLSSGLADLPPQGVRRLRQPGARPADAAAYPRRTRRQQPRSGVPTRRLPGPRRRRVRRDRPGGRPGGHLSPGDHRAQQPRLLTTWSSRVLAVPTPLDDQQPLGSGFGAHTTAAEVLAGVDLTGRTALVTGGYSGVGLEIVRAPARRRGPGARAGPSSGEGRRAAPRPGARRASARSTWPTRRRWRRTPRAVRRTPAGPGRSSTPGSWPAPRPGRRRAGSCSWPPTTSATSRWSAGSGRRIADGARVVSVSSLGPPLHRDALGRPVVRERLHEVAGLRAVQDRQRAVRGGARPARPRPRHPRVLGAPRRDHHAAGPPPHRGRPGRRAGATTSTGTPIVPEFKSPEAGAATAVWAATSPRLDGLRRALARGLRGRPLGVRRRAQRRSA